MTDPAKLSEEEQAKATLQAETEEINRLERLLSQHGQSAKSIAEMDEPVVAAEDKLFSRRTLFGWAFATLLVVFVIRMVLPEVFATVKETIGSKMREPSGNTSVAPVAPIVAPAAPTPPGLPTPPGSPAPDATPAPAATTGQPSQTVAPAAKPGATVIKIVKKR